MLNGFGRAEVGQRVFKTSKADMVTALKESSAICEAAFVSLTEATANQPAAVGESRLALLEFNFGQGEDIFAADHFLAASGRAQIGREGVRSGSEDVM